ncbi:globin [Bacillus coahuilensis m2-6]|uniref:Globin n=1 Tax=Bacillus coahuilensis p1.1.43 TaxID=1150625 RepID=A0A147KA21_9BACI|nr:globin [Bacillus coahuilensis]KUP07533.1 globin [Bacillus coahuilensis p1.1.43]KUP08996.1 globin [Bacillus coahuilensis m2-6]
MVEKPLAPYHLIGEKKLSMLVKDFYQRVSKHPDLAPLFPDDLTETARKQTQFLTQYLGGPTYYTDEHGHPMLRARHLPFEITPKRAKAWLQCMSEAMDTVEIDERIREDFFSRLALTAHHMINTTEPGDEQ